MTKHPENEHRLKLKIIMLQGEKTTQLGVTLKTKTIHKNKLGQLGKALRR